MAELTEVCLAVAVSPSRVRARGRSSEIPRAYSKLRGWDGADKKC